MMQEMIDAMREVIDGRIAGVHTALPGTIMAFNPQTGLATVLPTMKYRKPDGSTMEYPAVYNVPVVIPQAAGQNATIAYPIKSGDGCLLIFSEQSTELFLYGRETTTNLPFDLSNGIAIVGLFSKRNAALAEACSTNSVVISVGSTKMAVSNSGVSVTGNLNVSGDVIIGNLSIKNHRHLDSRDEYTTGPL